MRAGLVDLGCQMLTPPGAEYASGIVAFSHERAEEIGTALAEQNVIVWAGDGRVRSSLHLYNNAGDVARYLEVLKGILG
jgi:selenocysteine lyase/cysteine desulfurase